METVEQFAWIGWLALIAIFLVVEMVSGELTFLMLGLGSLFGLGSGLLGAPLWLQIIIAALAAVVLLLFVRPPLLRRLRRSADPQKFNAEAIIGAAGLVTEAVTETSGRVKLHNGDSWSARTEEGRALAPQTPVTVQSIRGATLIVTTRTSQEGLS